MPATPKAASPACAIDDRFGLVRSIVCREVSGESNVSVYLSIMYSIVTQSLPRYMIGKLRTNTILRIDLQTYANVCRMAQLYEWKHYKAAGNEAVSPPLCRTPRVYSPEEQGSFRQWRRNDKLLLSENSLFCAAIKPVEQHERGSAKKKKF